MAALFAAPSLPTVPTPPPAPSISTGTVQQAGAEELKKRQQAQGRASTFLTDPQTQREAQPNAQRYLGGV